MAVKNQHYIPRFLLKAFEIPDSQRQIWHFGIGQRPKRQSTRRTASEDFFYSDPDIAEHSELDPAITARESHDLSKILNSMRSRQPGESVGADDAASIAAHFAQRTSHVRSVLVELLQRMSAVAEKTYGPHGNVEALWGLRNGEPTERFWEHFAENVFPKLPAKDRSSPEAVGRLATEYLRLIKLYSPIAEGLLVKMARYATSESSEIVRFSHNDALSETLGGSKTEQRLRKFLWTVEPGPTAGAILPDCVGIALDANGRVAPLGFIGPDKMRAFVIALRPDKLLVGRHPEFGLPKAFDYNSEAASLSVSFFLASRKDEETLRLHGAIGNKIQRLILELQQRSEQQIKASLSVGSSRFRPS